MRSLFLFLFLCFFFPFLFFFPVGLSPCSVFDFSVCKWTDELFYLLIEEFGGNPFSFLYLSSALCLGFLILDVFVLFFL